MAEDVTTHHVVLRPDRMELLTTSVRLPERVERLENAVRSGIIGAGGGGGGAPTGPAGGDLSGTYPNPQLGAGVIFNADVNAAAAIAYSKLALTGQILNGDLAGGITLSKLAVDPLARANHTGTQLAATISDFNSAVQNNRLDQMAAPTADINMNNFRIVGLADPNAATGAATKNYVDTVAQGLDAKASVLVAYTTNITLSGSATVEGGVTPLNGQRVLVAGQTTSANNGIYIVNTSGAWTRALDADTWNELVSAYVFVEQGTYADTGWVCTIDIGGTLGTSPQAWTQFSGAGQVVAGAGLTKTGNQLDVGQGAGITVNADTIQITTGGITNAMMGTGDPSAATDIANKRYVDGGVQGLSAKQAVWLASTTNINIATGGAGSGYTIDGVIPNTVNGGPRGRVLLKNQTTPSENGIYDVTGTAGNPQTMARAADMDAWPEFPGAAVWVMGGNTQADTAWYCTSDPAPPGTILSNTWVQISGATGTAGGDLSGTYPNPQIAAGVIVNADVNSAAAIARSKLDFGAGLVNADIASGAAIAYAKLALTGAILNGDLAGSIALSKLATDPLARANHTGTQLAATISDFNTAVRTNRLDQMAAPTASVNLNNQKVTNLLEPTLYNDAATKNYVDSVAQGLDAKQSVVVATTGNITLSGTQTIDGRPVVANDRVLVKDQGGVASHPANGIYVVKSTAWVRSDDMDSGDEFGSSYVWVDEGTVNKDTGWVCTNDLVNIDSTAVAWVQFASAGAQIAGAGLTKAGNTLDVGAGAGITVNADSIQIANNGVTNAMIADGAINLATADVTGLVPIANGGTNNSTASGARSNLGAAGYYSSASHSAGYTISIPQSTHGLRASRGLLVQVQDEAVPGGTPGAVVEADVVVAANGDVTVTFSDYVTANTHRVTIIG